MNPEIKGLLISAAKELPFICTAIVYFLCVLKKKKKREPLSIRETVSVIKKKDFSKLADLWEVEVLGLVLLAYFIGCLGTWSSVDLVSLSIIGLFSLVLALFGVFTVSDAIMVATAGLLGAFACHGLFFTGKINLGIVGGTIGVASFVYLPKYLKAVWVAKKCKWAGIKSKTFYNISPYLPAGFIVSSAYYFLSQF